MLSDSAVRVAFTESTVPGRRERVVSFPPPDYLVPQSFSSVLRNSTLVSFKLHPLNLEVEREGTPRNRRQTSSKAESNDVAL